MDRALGKKLSDSITPIWKLHNPYCHSLQFNAFREMDSFHYTNDELSAFYFLSKLNTLEIVLN